LSRQWAGEQKYPFVEDHELPAVMQYVALLLRDPVTVKQRIVAQLAKADEPDFRNPRQVHALLADQEIPLYVTTNYDAFMSRALARVHKRPVTAFCPWYQGAEDDPGTSVPADYEPSEDEPLVYHLHGMAEHPPSLVLTEEDYVEFLVNLAMAKGADNRLLPHQVLRALTHKPLLFIGYSLRDWSFRTIFQGLMRTVSNVQQRRHVSVQLPPTDRDDARRQGARDHWDRYFDHLNIDVFWGTADEFCAELHRRLN
jgi:hypothetical protein